MAPGGYNGRSLPRRSRRQPGSLPLSHTSSARRLYDSYVPARAGSSRNEYPPSNNFRNVNRRRRSYYSPTPSPDRYNRPRSPEVEPGWSPAWKAPSPSTWQDKIPAPSPDRYNRPRSPGWSPAWKAPSTSTQDKIPAPSPDRYNRPRSPGWSPAWKAPSTQDKMPAPSPDRYNRPRSPGWSPAWKAPSTSTWQDKIPAPSSPPPTRDQTRRDTMATPMFEPSNAWKEAHVDRPDRPEIVGSPLADRYLDRRMRDFRNVSPGRPARNDYSPPYYPGGDRYRPTTYREAIPRSDTYRPRYDGDFGTAHIREPVSAGTDDHMRDLNTVSYGERTSSHNDHKEIRARSTARSITGSISPRSRPRSPAPDSRVYRETRGRRSFPSLDSFGKYEDGMAEKFFHGNETRVLECLEPPRKRLKSRSLSRSSIASSRVSDNQASPPCTTNSQCPSSHLIASSEADPNSAFPAKAGVAVPVSKESELLSQYSPRLSTHDSSPIKILPQDQSKNSSQNSAPTRIHITQRAVVQESTEMAGENVPTIAFSRDTDAQRPNDQGQASMSPKRGLQLADVANTQLQPASELHSSAALPCSCPSPISLEGKLPKDRKPYPWELPDDPCSTSMSRRPSSPLLLSVERPTDTTMKEDMHPAANGLSRRPTPTSPLLVDREPLNEFRLLVGQEVEVEPSSGTIVDDIPDYIPPMADAKSMTEALRIVVMTRLRRDRQTREERVYPVLLSNLSLAKPGPSRPSTSADALLSEFTEGERLETKMHSFTQTKLSLARLFAARQAALAAKTQGLQEEYLSLHERWLTHCARLDGTSKTSTSEETLPPSGRTTRRSAATLGDAVRSDLEMEQIIASLGNDELTDPNQLSARNVATIPDMVSVRSGQVDYLFDDTNNLVDEPCEFYGPHTGIHDWTDDEKAIFVDKFAAFPKQFGIIADYLPNKTAAQCVDYYYLHKKTVIDFRKIVTQFAPTKRRRGTRRTSKQKGNGLLADIRQHDDEVHRDLGSSALNGLTTRRRTAMPPPMVDRQKSGSRRNTGHLEPTPTSTPTPEPETRPKRRRTNPTPRASILAGKDEGEEDGTDTEIKSAKRGRKSSRKAKIAATSEEQMSTAGDTPSINQKPTIRHKPVPVHVQWPDADKNTFLGLLAQHGNDFKRIAASMPNKTTIQVSNYYKCNLVELDLEKVAAGAPKRSPTPEPPHDAWGNIPQYPGSGVMSPMPDAHLSPDIAPPMSSLDTESSIQTEGGASVANGLLGPGSDWGCPSEPRFLPKESLSDTTSDRGVNEHDENTNTFVERRPRAVSNSKPKRPFHRVRGHASTSVYTPTPLFESDRRKLSEYVAASERQKLARLPFILASVGPRPVPSLPSVSQSIPIPGVPFGTQG